MESSKNKRTAENRENTNPALSRAKRIKNSTNIPTLRKGRAVGSTSGVLVNTKCNKYVPLTKTPSKRLPPSSIKENTDEYHYLDDDMKEIVLKNLSVFDDETKDLISKKIKPSLVRGRRDYPKEVDDLKACRQEFRDHLEKWFSVKNQFLRDCKQVIETRGIDFKHQVEELNLKVQQSEEQFLKLKKRLKENEEKEIQLNKLIKEKDDDIVTVSRERFETEESLRCLHTQFKEVETKLEKHKSNSQTFEDIISHQEKDIATMKAQLDSVNDKLDQKEKEFSHTLATFSKTQESGQKQIEELQREKIEKQKDLNDFRDEVREIKMEREKLKQENQKKASLLQQIEEEKKEITRQLQDLQATYDKEMSSFKEKEKEIFSKFEVQIKETTEQLAKTEEENSKLAKRLQDRESEFEPFKEKIHKLEIEAYAAKTRVEDVQANAAHKEQSMKSEIETLKTTNESLRSTLDTTNEQARELTTKINTFQDNTGVGVNEQLEKLWKMSHENEILKEQGNQYADLIQQSKEKDHLIQELEKKLFTSESKVRKLHNTIQDLKGKVRVYVRIRPSTNKTSNEEESCTSVQSDCSVSIEARGRNQDFSFDRVFSGFDSQQTVFDEVSPFVQSALDGYNTCLIAYGQTGAGKTYTMVGGKGEDTGIIRRSCQKILSTAESLQELGWTYTFNCSYLEIYNETVRDLLDSNSKKVCKVVIGNKVRVENLSERGFSTLNEVEGIVAAAENRRSVSYTDMNAQSSRSHSVFILRLKGFHSKTKVELDGCLYLCDLAGSERLNKSKATGSTLTETQHINKSLSALTHVFRQIQTKSAHINTRDSKLTSVLKPCFEQSGKAMMIVALAPEKDNGDESLCSLKFAEQANKTELGKGTRNAQVKK